MEEAGRERFNLVWKIAEGDREYCRMLERNAELEKGYFEVLETLPIEQQDAIQDFLMSCEGLSWRMLEVACEIMRFP